MSYPDSLPQVPVPPAASGYVMPPAPGAAGVLTNDGNGNLSWQPGGGGSLPVPPGPDLILKSSTDPTPVPVWTNELFLGNF